MSATPILPVGGLLRCRVCKQAKPLTAFFRDKAYACGHETRCKRCKPKRRADPERRAREAAYKRRPEVYARTTETLRAWRHTEKGRLRVMIRCARDRARDRGLAFDISTDDLRIPERCPLLDIPITFGKGRLHAGSPSLDRIDPSLGYVRGNVWVISYRANAIKQDATHEELELIATRLRARRTGQ